MKSLDVEKERRTDRNFSDVTIFYYEGCKTRKQNNVAKLILKSVQTDKTLSNMLKQCM